MMQHCSASRGSNHLNATATDSTCSMEHLRGQRAQAGNQSGSLAASA